MKTIKAHGGELIKVDNDQYDKLSQFTWYVYDRKTKSKQIVNCKGQARTKVLFGDIWSDNDFKKYTKLGEQLDCRAINYVVNEIHDHHVKVLATKTEHARWRKLADKKSLSAIGAELFNKECDKRGIK